MNSLDELKALLTPAKRHLLDKAFALGENEAGLKLLSKPKPALMSPGSLPPLHRNIMLHALLLNTQYLHAEWYVDELTRADKMRVSQLKQATLNNFNYFVDLLTPLLKIKDSQGQLSDKEATKHYLESFRALIWELLDALLSSSDPVRFVSMMQLIQSGVARIEEETESTSVAA
ncbi:hypothetical protein LJ737_20900 [Hymenobacter sp. 15J16-1T3B]|uniref:hypothetical protein n=1 Tax=Hymenobacter sp. 15J16-1T3B TaxID=2886941 RepID=UPI001D12E8F8|nr:hypothetical protein [Hymenobacter sp. 15J16-1T3B]MCC3159713.1 hypothetical protein [Hymenobacter sp. 15J16-1T3B]